MAEEAPEGAHVEFEEVVKETPLDAIQDENPNLEDEAPVLEEEAPGPEDVAPARQEEASGLEDVAPPLEDEAPAEQGEGAEEGEEKPASQAEESPPQIIEPSSTAEGGLGEETEDEGEAEPKEISAEEHEENIVAMEKVLDSLLNLAAEGKLPEREGKIKFEMKEVDSTEDLLVPRQVEELEEEETEEEIVSPEGSLEEKVLEEEEAESKSVQEAWARRQLLLEEFDALYDEGQRLRIMNMLLHSKVLRCMQRRPKAKTHASSVSTVSRTSAPAVADTAAMAESLEKELLEAGEVRCQLEAELHCSEVEEELRLRLSTARRLVSEKEAQLQVLQEKAMSKLRAPLVRRQEAEQMLNRVWPQLLRLRKERILHTRATQELESARKQVAELEVFGRNRTVAAYEQLSADGVKLAEHVQERTEQLAALRNDAERDLQQAAHLRESLQGAHQNVADTRRGVLRASIFLQKARQEVLNTKKRRDDLYKENSKLTQQMELLAYPELLHDHEEVRRRLRMAKADLEKLRTAYVNQEKRIAAARRLLQQREQSLREGVHGLSPHQSFVLLHMDAMCGPSLLDTKRER
ncbi:coiled-coil domain-containing protein 96-like [Schistocerca americana]|uniref:coiled-coil domain-containing protein 96-like n=1 Tax=Schistocerca americana TaxID=7009 RepID=UPI001F4FD3C9|nr:coiled-coil domain-containing protein 96-like [Schistocerca americana]